MIVDAKDQILGRIATHIAKMAILGETVDVINCESMIISGRPEQVLARYQKFQAMGSRPNKGPFLPRMPDRFVRRAIKRMIPFRTTRGKEAFQRVMCHIGTPDEFKGKETTAFEGTNVSKLPNMYYTSVGDVCKKLGAKI